MQQPVRCAPWRILACFGRACDLHEHVANVCGCKMLRACLGMQAMDRMDERAFRAAVASGVANCLDRPWRLGALACERVICVAMCMMLGMAR